MLIDIILAAAVYEAQKHQATTPVKITGSAGIRLTLDTDHVMIIPDCPVDEVVVADRITFHGLLANTIMVVDHARYRFFTQQLLPPVQKFGTTFCSPSSRYARSKMKRLRSRPNASLCSKQPTAPSCWCPDDGLLWVFYIAAANPEGVTIYRSLYLNGRTERGLIVATLIELIRNPGTLPRIFTILED
ncbi:hypothetical protein C8R44DRAFT_876540 [Mycena epipterygia]|nr:hypothetical protein C8R44DRAFT_876540 [Mycena epipterygia]